MWMQQRRDKTEPENPQAEPARPLTIDEGGVFVVHGKRNPEGGIRRWREAEYAERVMKDRNVFPSGVLDSMSDNAVKEVVNQWLRENTDWQVLECGVLKHGEVSRRTVGRIRKLLRG
jgi:hypothetical protein